MPTNKPTTKIAEVLIDEDEVIEDYAPSNTPAIIVSNPTKNAKVKGTWTMYFGAQKWNFVDGRRYDLPPDLYEYLRKNGNIYDTL